MVPMEPHHGLNNPRELDFSSDELSMGTDSEEEFYGYDDVEISEEYSIPISDYWLKLLFI